MKYKAVVGFYTKATGRVKPGAVTIPDKALAAHLIAQGYIEKPKAKPPADG